MDFCTGDRVVYGIHGVCTVVEEERRTVDKKQVVYLVLEPQGQNGSRYLVPTHNASAMSKIRSLLSREELETFFTSASEKETLWIADENHRKQNYRGLIGSGNRLQLAGMVCTLYRHRNSQAAAGKKCHMCDENFLRDAEKLLCSEICAVMDMEPDEAKRYLRERLK